MPPVWTKINGPFMLSSVYARVEETEVVPRLPGAAFAKFSGADAREQCLGVLYFDSQVKHMNLLIRNGRRVSYHSTDSNNKICRCARIWTQPCQARTGTVAHAMARRSAPFRGMPNRFRGTRKSELNRGPRPCRSCALYRKAVEYWHASAGCYR